MSEQSQDRPNIILILTDQQKLSAVGCYGETPCRTPNIDRLAREGIRFETAYTVCPVCSPARATIMTGLYPHAHGVCTNVHNLGCSIHELTDRPTLLSRRLRAVGYRCGYSGKWHLGTDCPTAYGAKNTPTLPKDVGFEGQNFPGHGTGGFRYPEYRAYLKEHGFDPETRLNEDYRYGIRVTQATERPPRVGWYGVLDDPLEATVPYYLTENTIQLIDRFAASGQPFFCWHNFWGPHVPFYATREFYEIYRDIEIPPWPNYEWPARQTNGPHQLGIHPHAEQLSWEDWAEAIRHYYASTTMIDQQIGRIIDHLSETGLRENTIVIFTSDHGETLGTHGGLVDKGWMHFEEIQRIAFIAWLPGQYWDGERAPRVVDEWVSLLDVYPTVLDLAGADYAPDEIHGRSLVPLLRDEPVEWRDKVYVECGGQGSLATTMVSVRDGDYKYGWNCSNWDELYNLADDPYEMKNLLHDPQQRARVREFREILESWMIETRYPGLNSYRRSRMSEFCK